MNEPILIPFLFFIVVFAVPYWFVVCRMWGGWRNLCKIYTFIAITNKGEDAQV